MRVFDPGTTVRVMQEDWGVFQNLPRTAARFSEQSGVKVEVTLTVIPEMWELMERSFSGEDPPFDLVGVDDLLLIQAARAGRVEPLDDLIAGDSYPLDDFTKQALAAVSDGGHIWGLPYCDVSNVLIYRADLFDKYGIALPETLDDLTRTAVEIQGAVRADGTDDFYGITIRGAPSCGLNFWMVGSTWGPSFGARWYDERGQPTLDTAELRAAVEHYADLVRRAGPPESPTMDFMDVVACYTAGRAAMTIEPANEASILYDEGGPVADGTKTAVVPAGPLGTRHAGLYCPPYAIPSLSQSKEAAWELAKFLCAPEQVLEDAQNSGFVEVSRNSVLSDPAFIGRFRPDLVETTVATRAHARGERPVTWFGMEVGDIIGDEIVRVLTGELTSQEAMQIAEQRVGALGTPD
jgi:ABC-type glycerol-3-phosphate transport system substrate-binding protein